ncbi:hypothetical protein Tco_1301050 [Tanacetum coccineum]
MFLPRGVFNNIKDLIATLRRSEVAVIASAAVVAVGGSEMERDEVRGWPAVVDIRGEGGIGGGRGGVVVVSSEDWWQREVGLGGGAATK